MAFELRSSNDLAILAEGFRRDLAAARAGDGADPFYSEVVVVNSRGMENWLVQQLGGIDGPNSQVVANLRFVTPNALIEFCLLHLDGTSHRWGDVAGEPDRFARPVLAWRLYDLLGDDGPCAGDSAYAPLAAYLSAAGGDRERRRFQLARELADVYDQYQIHRPGLLEVWKWGRESGGAGGASEWQAPLWRLLIADDAQSRDRRLATFCKRIGAVPISPRQLSRVWLFGMSTMAPCYLHLFRALGSRMPVRFYLRNPSPAYWLEEPSPAQRMRLRKRLAERDESTLMDELPPADPLLTSFGGLVRDFLRELMDQTDGDVDVDLSDDALFRVPAEAPGNLLASLQQGVALALEDEPVPAAVVEALAAGSDRSLRIHACHSRMREIEVLHDQLLDWFDDEGGPEAKLPRQIVIMAPTIEDYVPFIEAVFKRTAPDAATRLPYTIADRTTIAESVVVQTFLGLLKLPQMRFRATEIFDLLGVAAVARAYRLSERDLEVLQGWVAAANVRWGIDGNHRDDLGFSGLGAANSWQTGLDRLFAGYAMADAIADPASTVDFAGIIPHNEVEGGQAALLGQLAQVFHDLRELRNQLRQPHAPAEWHRLLTDVLDRFFVPDDAIYNDLAGVRRALDEFIERTQTAGIQDPIPLSVVESYLGGELRNAQSSSLFCRGRITFCSMLPMRSIPADFIWLLGMNDGAFPRRDPRRDFNLIHSGPRMACDRSTRLDDRYTFLEAIVSARRRLHLSYLGQSLQDNAERPPSAVVRELLAVLVRRLPGNKDLVSKLTVRHPLHPFSRRNFPASIESFGPFTYDADKRLAAGVLYDGGVKAPGLIFPPGTRLPELRPDDPLYDPDAEQLADFFVRPCSTLLQKRLGIYFESGAEAPSDEETTDLDSLAAYSLDGTILAGLTELVAEEADPGAICELRNHLYDRLLRAGSLPLGSPGEEVFVKQWQKVHDYLAAKLRGKDLPADCKGVPFARLLLEAPAGVVVRHRMSKIKDKDLVRALVLHLAANAEGEFSASIVAGKGTGKSPKNDVLHPPIDETGRDRCREHLQRLLAIYRFGMQQALPFVAPASFPYEETRRKGPEKLEDARKKADGGWLGGYYPAYDGVGSAANRYCLGSESLLDREPIGELVLPGITAVVPVTFETIAKEVYDLWAIWSKPQTAGGEAS